MEKEMCEEPDVETARTGNDKVDSRKSKEWWVQIKAKLAIVDQQISNLIKHLDNLRTLLQLGKAKDQAAVDLNIHWLMVELDTGNSRTCSEIIPCQGKYHVKQPFLSVTRSA